MSSIPSIPPAIAAAAGAVGSRDSQSDSVNKTSASSGQQIAIEASSDSGDRDADGRDLREHRRKREEVSLEEALEEASGADERGGLDVSV